MHENEFTYATADYKNDKKTLPPKFNFSEDKWTKPVYTHIPSGKIKPCLEWGGRGYKTWFLKTNVFSFKQNSFVQFIMKQKKKKKLGILSDRITFATKPVS